MTMTSNYPVSETLDRLTAILEEKGISIIARVNHAAAAQKVGMDLRPTELLLFGNPKLGTPLMQSNQEAGFDLPMKALAWQDENGATKLRVTDPNAIRDTHDLDDVDSVIETMTAALDKMASAAAT